LLVVALGVVELASRGTLKFDLAKPIPYDLIRRVVRALAA